MTADRGIPSFQSQAPIKSQVPSVFPPAPIGTSAIAHLARQCHCQPLRLAPVRQARIAWSGPVESPESSRRGRPVYRRSGASHDVGAPDVRRSCHPGLSLPGSSGSRDVQGCFREGPSILTWIPHEVYSLHEVSMT